MRFIRFVVAHLDDESGYRRGFIHAASELDKKGELSGAESARLKAILKWFNTCLPVPSRFTRTRNANHKNKRALSWFKEAALTELRHAHDLVELLKAHDVVVEMITTERPGYVVYEDEYQVVAEPFHDTQT